MDLREKFSSRIEEYLSAIKYPTLPEELYAPIAYSLGNGGKRLRPVMVLMACHVFSDKIDDALPCAAAVEMFHNFTLLHDDIIDNADVRRGQSSVHKKWGSNIAILSGDAMVVYSYKMLQKTPHDVLPAVMAEYTKTALEVCEGQQFDINFEQREDVSLDEYMNMIRLKTAVLFAGAAKMGAMIGGASDKQAGMLYNAGLEIGLAFQLQDDYLDTYGTPEILGKNIGGDIAESKKTFLTITALNEAGDATRRALLATFKDDSHPLPHKINRVKTIYNSLDIPEITKAAVTSHLDRATAALDKTGAPAERLEPLYQLITGLANRNK